MATKSTNTTNTQPTATTKAARKLVPAEATRTVTETARAWFGLYYTVEEVDNPAAALESARQMF
jgi:selenocysteine lyase/cysteine desulfurase